MGRWSSHLIEHTVQVEKTLDRRPSEVARLVRHLHAAWGRLEALVFPMAAAELARRDDLGRSVDRLLAGLAAELQADARSAREAALS